VLIAGGRRWPGIFSTSRGGHLVRDEEGTDLAGPEHARAHALQSARELCADAIKAGRDLDADAFVVADEQGQSLTFVPVVEVLPKRLRDRRR
jgi:hypothetical protein